jgi:hypothetical protein
MRWTLIACLNSLLVGFVFGLAAAPSRVVMRSEFAAPLAPEMSVARFLHCSEAQPEEFTEAQWDAQSVGWTLRHWRPEGMDWPTP